MTPPAGFKREVSAPPPGFDDDGVICTGCLARDEEIDAVQSEKRVWIARCNRLERERKNEAETHDLFPVGREVFDLWKAVTRKTRARWTTDRFELIRPFLEREGVADCKMAVHGLMASKWHEANNALDFEFVFSPKADRQRRFERFRDLGVEALGDPDPFFVGTEPNLFDADGGIIKRLRERVLALELSHADPERTATILAEIHQLTEAPR